MINDRSKMFFLFFLVLLPIFWVGFKTYRYFTHNSSPLVTLECIEEGKSFKTKIEGVLKADTPYKVAYITVLLDGKEVDLGSQKWIGSKKFVHKFSFDVSKVSNGKHLFEFEVVDSSYHKNKVNKNFEVYVDNEPLQVTFLYPEYSIDQGKTLRVRVQANKKLACGKIKFLSIIRPFASDIDENSNTYEALIPIDCEENAGEFVATAELQDLVQNTVKLSARVKINAFNFPKQKGFSVNQEKFKEDNRLGKGPKEFNDVMLGLTKNSSTQKLWSGAFEFPMVVRRMTTPFGEIRVTPEWGKYMHHGVDLVDMPKSAVWATQAGKVVLIGRYARTGNTVVIDHGLGVLSVYAHLEDYADIHIGDMVKRGNPVGRVGMTGYANGYHLHWEIKINNISVDPIDWIKKSA